MHEQAPAHGYRDAREGAAWLDRSDRVRVEFTGDKAGETLNGLLTNDIARLEPGTGCYAAALTPKGKIIADVRVFALADRFIVDTPAAAGPGLLAMLKKFVNPRLARFRDASADVGVVSVLGPRAASLAATAMAMESEVGQLGSLAPYSSVARETGSFVARVPDFGVPAFDLVVPRRAVAATTAVLRQQGAVELSPAGAEILRVEAGRPLWGTDMDETVLAQEAALDAPHLDAIAFDKGCYTGQETVARVHFRGHVNRALRGLRSDVPLVAGSRLEGPDGEPVGDLRSAVVSPRRGPIALGYVRREIPDGATVSARAGDSIVPTVVGPLPFA